MNITDKTSITPLATYNDSYGAYSVDSVYSIAISSDGNYLATSSPNGDYVSIMEMIEVIDTTPPQWANNQTNSTIAGTTINHSVYWTDETALSGYIFSFDNGTGTLVNDSWVSFIGTTNWSNVSKIVNLTVGSNIQWMVYANDTTNNLNATDIFSYTTTSAQCWSYTPATKTLYVPSGCTYYIPSGQTGYIG